MKVNMKKYQPKLPTFTHYGFENSVAMDFSREFDIMWFLGITIVTYLVRLFSYSEPGIIYSTSTAMTMFTIIFYGYFVGKIQRGKANVFYRREYVKIHGFMMTHKKLSMVASAVFTGNTAYYLSRSRIWNEPGQIEIMFSHAFDLFPFIGVAVLSAWIIYYLFFNEQYIHISDYNKRMQVKVSKFKMSKKDAFLELLKEMDEYHFNAQLRAVEPEKTKSEKKEAKLVKKIYEDDHISEEFLEEVIQENEYDVYESAKIKRGD